MPGLDKLAAVAGAPMGADPQQGEVQTAGAIADAAEEDRTIVMPDAQAAKASK